MAQKMNLHLLLLALLVFISSYGSEARAIDDVDNSIESGAGDQSAATGPSSASLQPRTRFGQDWIKFTKTPPVKILQSLGSPVEIACEVMGSQIPTIQWVVGHIPLSEIETIESNVISESSASAIVKVRSVHVIDHMLSEARTYTCVGRTGSKTVYASTIVYPQSDLKDLVQVREKPFMGHVKPRIVYSERMHLDLVGSNVVLPCKVHARPRAEVFWMNDEGNLIEQNQRFKLLPSGDLLISDLKWEDMGAYKCIARNALGKDTADAFIYPVQKEDK
ncbi:neural/ectodermal development factor IMP-L2 isoform X1 [Lucilia cuprina]|uniref:neural/ectodermal development factor IMP-L2 isoform X1 n=2 Tax=Lucilia cuprina TaxID=7375 RepID=UPI001F06B3DC|nr:neural/ectodermal development factor IMP-L2 isoform X1 [Lucilia cuprina]